MKVTAEGLLEGVPQHPTVADSGPFPKPPTLLVMHYTASGGTALDDAKFFEKQTKAGASAHLIIGRDGKLYQCESLKTIAHHAGRSAWRGRNSCNSFSIGIELDKDRKSVV